MAFPTITCTGVNSGTAITLKATTINYNVEVFSNAPAVPGKSTSGSFIARLHPGRNAGFDTPTLTLTTVIKLGQAHVTGASAVMDFEYVLDFVANAHQVMTLTNDAFITSTNATGSKTVMLANVSTTSDTSDVMGVTLQFIEVNSNS